MEFSGFGPEAIQLPGFSLRPPSDIGLAFLDLDHEPDDRKDAADQGDSPREPLQKAAQERATCKQIETDLHRMAGRVLEGHSSPDIDAELAAS
jgi:hypothetical protein